MKKQWTESSAWDAVKGAGDLLALNVMCFLCCLPVITIVASFSAMYSVLFKLRRDRSIPVIRTFFSSFKENVLPSIAVEAVAVVLGVFAYGDAYYALTQAEGTQRFLFLTVATIVGVIALILLTYGTAQIANFRNSVKNYIKNSFVLALIAPGWMVLVWLIWLAVLGVLAAFPRFVLQYLGWAYFMWGLSFPAFVSAAIFAKVFKRFEKADAAAVSGGAGKDAGALDEEGAGETADGADELSGEDAVYETPYRQPDEDLEDQPDSQTDETSGDSPESE